MADEPRKAVQVREAAAADEAAEAVPEEGEATAEFPDEPVDEEKLDDEDEDTERAAGADPDALVGLLGPATYPLVRKYFPSKVGGRPAWLNPRDLPAPESLLCGSCQRPLQFLLQAYAPLDSTPAAFHRTVYLFVCGRGSCHKAGASGAARAWRCQLPRDNPFYGPEPVEPPEADDGEGDGDDAAEQADDADEPWPGVSLCDVCGARGPKSCAKCRAVHYCGREHQVEAWRAGHSKDCARLAAGEPRASALPCASRFPLHELLVEDEPPAPQAETGPMAVAVTQGGLRQGMEPDDERTWTSSGLHRPEDRTFEVFRARVARLPAQVLRYATEGGDPLWADSANRADAASVPPCQSCGQPRRFELQVMPQLLHLLGVDSSADDSLDWGTLALFTCSASCGADLAYREEFVWRQPMPS